MSEWAFTQQLLWHLTLNLCQHKRHICSLTQIFIIRQILGNTSSVQPAQWWWNGVHLYVFCLRLQIYGPTYINIYFQPSLMHIWVCLKSVSVINLRLAHVPSCYCSQMWKVRDTLQKVWCPRNRLSSSFCSGGTQPPHVPAFFLQLSLFCWGGLGLLTVVLSQVLINFAGWWIRNTGDSHGKKRIPLHMYGMLALVDILLILYLNKINFPLSWLTNSNEQIDRTDQNQDQRSIWCLTNRRAM